MEGLNIPLIFFTHLVGKKGKVCIFAARKAE